MTRIIMGLAIVITALFAPGHAMAEQCAHKAIKATGSPAIFESAAKSRARSAWIARVKASRKLGAPYAAWLRAKDPSYACRKSGRHRVCDAVATPCKV